MLGPEQLALLRAAFDAVWEEVAQHYQSSPTSFEVARLRVANAVIAAYRHGTTELVAIKAAAVQSFVAAHPGLLPSVADGTAEAVRAADLLAVWLTQRSANVG